MKKAFFAFLALTAPLFSILHAANNGPYVGFNPTYPAPQTAQAVSLSAPATTVAGGTQGSVVFISTGGVLGQSNSQFFWSEANGRLGIMNAAPSYALDVTGTGRFTGILTIPSAGVALPSLCPLGDLTTGIGMDNGDIYLNTSGSTRFQISTTQLSTTLQGSAGTPVISGGSGLGMYFAGGNSVAFSVSTVQKFSITATGVTAVVALTPSAGIVGSATSDSATAGNYGEVISTGSVAFGNIAGTGTFGNIVSVAYTSGTWLLSGCVTLKLNGAAITDYEIAVSSFSANTTTDHVESDNWMESAAVPIASANSALCVTNFLVTLAGNTTMYLKVKGAYSVATPQALGKLKGVRPR